MNGTHYKAIKKGARVWNRYYRLCKHLNDTWSADLSWANLYGANLYGANLSWANLSEADLSWANLYGANLSWADLSGGHLSWANLSGANLYGANLSWADLSWADLSGGHLSNAENSEFSFAQTSIVPEVGAFDGWKKCIDGIIVHVRIPAIAKRSNASGRKCRAECVKVLEVIGGDVGISTHDGKTEYRKGETVRCDKWDDNRWNECSGGIHFFISRIEAENYN